jgi:WD40 repeat protein
MTNVRVFTALVVLAAVAAIATWLVSPSATAARSSLTIRGEGGEVTALAFAPDGLTLAFASTKGADVRTWDIPRRSEKHTLKTPGVVSHLRFTPSCGLIAWDPAWEDKVRAWDAGGRLVSVPRPFSKPCSELVYCPESQTFAVASEDQGHKSSKIILEDANSGSKRFTLDVLGSITTPMAITPDGRFLAVGTMTLVSDPTFVHPEVYVWDIKNGTARSQFCIPGAPNRLELSPDGRFLAAWWLNEGMVIEIWDVKIGKIKTTLRANIKASLSDVKFSPDGRTLAVGAGDRTSSMVPVVRGLDRVYGEVRLWELPTAKNVETFVTSCPVTRIAFSADGRSLAVGCDDGTVELWAVPKP